MPDIEPARIAEHSPSASREFPEIAEGRKLPEERHRPWHQGLDLLWILVARSFESKYQRTFMGPLWLIANPLLVTIVLYVVFARWIRVPTDGIAAVLFYWSGLLVWSGFSRALADTARTFFGNAPFITKVYFPRLLLPCSTVLFALLELAVQWGIFAVVYLAVKTLTPHGANLHLHWTVFALPLFLLQAAALGMGVGLWMAALSVRMRDILGFVGAFTQLWFFASPVIYPLSVVSDRKEFILSFNPVAVLLEGVRAALFGTGSWAMGYCFSSAVITALVLAGGIWAFRKAEYYFADHY